MATFQGSIFHQMNAFLQKAQLHPQAYIKNAKDFSRQRKLDFATTFLLILGLLKKVCR